MAFGFQYDTGTATARFGTGDDGGYKAMPFGGGFAGTVYEPPIPQIGSDNPENDIRTSVGESVLMRNGLPIAARIWAERQRWRLVYRRLDVTDMVQLRGFFLARRFRLLPNSLNEAVYFMVRWEQSDFDARQLRGGQFLFDLTFDLVEVP